MKERNSNLELLRIVSMLYIVCFHTFRYTSTCNFNTIQMIIYHCVRWYGLLGVNCFLLLTAYFSIGRDIKTLRLIPMIMQTMFYCIALFACRIIYDLLTGVSDIGNDLLSIEATALVSPLWANRYWFITAYIFLYLMIPFLNDIIKSMSASAYKHFIIALSIFIFLYQSLPQTFANTSVICDFIWVSYVYLVMGYYKIHASKSIFFRHPLKAFLITYAVFVFSKTILSEIKLPYSVSYILEHSTGSSYRYSPVMLILALGLFYSFNQLNLHSKTINSIAACVFGVYLFHENKNFHVCELLYKTLYKPFTNAINIAPITDFVYMLLMLILIFISGTLIEMLRKLLFAKSIEKKACEKLSTSSQKLDNILNSYHK